MAGLKREVNGGRANQLDGLDTDAVGRGKPCRAITSSFQLKVP